MADDIETLRLRAKAKAKASRERVGSSPDLGKTVTPQLTPRQRLKPTGLESALGNVSQQLNAYPAQSFPEQFGKEAFQAGVGGIQKMVGAFQPPTTQSLTKDPLGRLVESGGRGGEFGLGAAQLLGSPLAGLFNRIPESVNKGLDFAIEHGTPDVGGISLYNLGKAFAQSRQIPEVVQTAKDITKLGAYAGATAGIGAGIKGFQNAAPKIRAKTALRAGELVGAGENMSQARRAGQYMIEKNIPTTKTGYIEGKHGVEATSLGEKQSLQNVNALNQALNEKIIKPATEAGVKIPENDVLGVYENMKKEFSTMRPPKRSAIAMMDKIINDTKEQIKASGGELTPTQAQEIKVLNNEILYKYYKQTSREGGQLSPLAKMEESARAEGNSFYRKTLEKIDPQIEGINWTEGAGLDLAKALDAFYQARLRKDPSLVRGSGITGAAMGRPRLVTLFGVTELMAFRPFRIAYNRFLNKLATKVSGQKSEFVNPNQIKPFQPPNPSGSISDNLVQMQKLFPGYKPSPRISQVAEHKSMVESLGAKYLGTNAEGTIFFDDHKGSTGGIPKGTSLEDARKIINESNRKKEPPNK